MGKFIYQIIKGGNVRMESVETDPANPSREDVLEIIRRSKEEFKMASNCICHLNGDITVELIGKILQVNGYFNSRIDGSIGQPKGEEKGQRCNRDGCNGIIAEYEGSGCSCHIVAPCANCTTDRSHCPSCGWEAENGN